MNQVWVRFFCAATITGETLGLWRITSEHRALVSREREVRRRLEDSVTREAIVAHELSSAIGALGALVDMLTVEALSADDRSRVASTMRSELGILHTLVDDLKLSPAFDDDGLALHMRPVDIEQLLSDVVSHARVIKGAHSLQLDHVTKGYVRADPNRITQVLHNLLNNAIDHTPPGTTIRLSAVEDGDCVLFQVRDSGPGIPEHDQRRIFTKNGRGHHFAESTSIDRGLGLYLAKSLLRLHGSELALSSTPDTGTCFSFRLERMDDPGFLR